MKILLLVSHPDDDAVFAGELQHHLDRHCFHAVCLTHTRESNRGREMMAWQRSLGNPAENVTFLGFEDDPEDRRQQRCSISEDEVRQRMIGLALSPDLVVTHNTIGEYGHPHHLLTHRVANSVYGELPLLMFGHGLGSSDFTLPCPEKWTRAAHCYASQKHILNKMRIDTESHCWLRQPGPPMKKIVENARHTCAP